MSKTVQRIVRYRWLIPISLTLLTIFSIVSLPLPSPRDPTAEVYIGNEPFWFKPSVLDGVYVRDVFRTKDDEMVMFFLKDYRNTINIEVKIGETYHAMSYDCYYPQCQGTFDECTYQDFYGTLKFNSSELVDNTISIKISEFTLEHSFNLLDVRQNGPYTYQLAVVLQPAYYLADWQNLIQYFESWLTHGATKFYVYHYSWTRQVDDVIKFYKNKLGDGLEILPWSSFPVREVDKGRFSVDANTRMFNLVSEAAMNNALYRAKGKVKFIAMMDLDELMYVGGGHQLIPLLRQLDEESPDAAQFSFEWIHAGAQISLARLKKPADINFDYLHTVKPVTNDSLESIYFTSRKVIHMPDRVEILDTHNTLKNYIINETMKYETIMVDSGRAACWHIRRIFDAAKLQEDKKNLLAKHITEINENYKKRIENTSFTDLQMSPWLADYRTTLMTLHDCRRVTRSKYRKIVRGGLTQCRSVRGCEQFLGGQEHFVYAENSWTNLATRFDVLGDIFPMKI